MSGEKKSDTVEQKLSENTVAPLYWIFTAVGLAVTVGMAWGGVTARVSAAEADISDLKKALLALPAIDRRLANMEGARGVKASPEDRFSSEGK